MVRAYLNKSDVYKIKANLENPNPVDYVLAIEEMRKMGWKTYEFPFTKIFTISKPSVEKANIYFQSPEGLTEDEIIQFTKILLKLGRSDPSDHSDPDLRLLKDSKKHSHKQRISSFYIDPHQTTPGYYQGDNDYPVIFHSGDATADLPFRLGQGLILGAERILAAIELLKFITVKSLRWIQTNLINL